MVELPLLEPQPWKHRGESELTSFLIPYQLSFVYLIISLFILKLMTSTSLCHRRNWTCSRGQQEVVDGTPRDTPDSSSWSLPRPSLARFKGCSGLWVLRVKIGMEVRAEVFRISLGWWILLVLECLSLENTLWSLSPQPWTWLLTLLPPAPRQGGDNNPCLSPPELALRIN